MQWQIQGGCNSANAPPPFKKSKKNSFLAIFGGFWAVYPCCVCYTTESAPDTWTRWAGNPKNSLTCRGLHKNTPLHFL